jgi:hypothetical protein
MMPGDFDCTRQSLEVYRQEAGHAFGEGAAGG